jgi:DMSO/TMAO reductase YedYZ heme-binding membrane subunit
LFLSRRRNDAATRRRDVVVVVQAVLLRVVDRDALAAGAATFALGHENTHAGLALEVQCIRESVRERSAT